MTIDLKFYEVESLPEYFDGLSRSDLEAVRDKTEKIRSLVRKSAEDVREIGRQLIQAKEILGHGRWAEYLFHNFGWEERTARNFMSVAVRFSQVKSEIIADFAPTVLTMLAAPSTPQAAVDEAMDLAEQGHAPAVKETKALIEKHKTDVSLERATAGLPPAKAAEVKRVAVKEGRRDKLAAIERHCVALRKLVDGEPDIGDEALIHLDTFLNFCREGLS